MEIFAEAVLLATLQPPQPPRHEAWRELMDSMSAVSCKGGWPLLRPLRLSGRCLWYWVEWWCACACDGGGGWVGGGGGGWGATLGVQGVLAGSCTGPGGVVGLSIYRVMLAVPGKPVGLLSQQGCRGVRLQHSMAPWQPL